MKVPSVATTPKKPEPVPLLTDGGFVKLVPSILI
jgi:hypothetical protein